VGIKKFLVSNENENITYQNLWGTAKAIVRGKFIAMTIYIKKPETQINNLVMHLRLLEKQEQNKPQINRQKDILSIETD
jgi:hypothetical protein